MPKKQTNMEIIGGNGIDLVNTGGGESYLLAALLLSLSCGETTLTEYWNPVHVVVATSGTCTIMNYRLFEREGNVSLGGSRFMHTI
jgi:hypothetical protein